MFMAAILQTVLQVWDTLLGVIGTVTFFAVLSFVARIADTSSHNAGPMAAACDVNALVSGHVTLGALPTAVAHAATFKVLTVPTAQHRTGRCEKSRQHTCLNGLSQP